MVDRGSVAVLFYVIAKAPVPDKEYAAVKAHKVAGIKQFVQFGLRSAGSSGSCKCRSYETVIIGSHVKTHVQSFGCQGQHAEPVGAGYIK